MYSLPTKTRNETSSLPSTLEGFHNFHAGETIIVCGCGASLNDLPTPKRFITIGVNDVGRKFDPTYLVVLNPRQQFNNDRFHYVEHSRAQAIFTQLDLGIRHPHIVRFRLGKRSGTDFSNPHVLHYTRNSPYVALCLAIHMGAKRIGLIGVDFTDHHFFAQTGRHPLNSSLYAINEEYNRLAKVSKELGVEVINLSKQSSLTVFPKKDINSLFTINEETKGEVTNDTSLPRIFIVHYQFLSCGDVFTRGLEHAALNLGIHYTSASWEDRDLPAKIEGFSPDLILVIHGRRFRQRWGCRFKNYRSAIWLLDEPYEVDDSVITSSLFDFVFLNDPSTLHRHKNAHYLPVAYDPHVHVNMFPQKHYDVGFIGGYSSVRESFLLALLNAGLLSYVVGGPWRTPQLQKLCLSGSIPPSKTAELYQKTSIILNVFREQHHFNRQNISAQSLNPRIYEALACGAMVISEWRPEIDTVFPHLPTFKTNDELVAIVQKLLNNKKHKDDLLSLCHQNLNAHTYEKRLEIILQKLTKKKDNEMSIDTLKKSKNKVKIPENWIASDDLKYEYNDNCLIISASHDNCCDVGIISNNAPSQIELSFDLKLNLDTNFIAKIHWQDRNDGTTNSYHIISNPGYSYIAKHNFIFKQITLQRGEWQSILLRRVDHGLLELSINGVIVVEAYDNQLQSGYCFLGISYGKAEFRNICLRDLARHDNDTVSFNQSNNIEQPVHKIYAPPFSEMPIRNLIYHVWPVKRSIWRWNLEQLVKRIDIFNGKRIIGIVYDDLSENPEEVMNLLTEHGCEFIVQPNSNLGETITFPHMLQKVASSNPNELTFYGHAKGVKYRDHLPNEILCWTETQYRVSLDNWLMVKEHMEHFALTGPFRMLGRFKTHRNLGDWHYSGTNFWMRHSATFTRDCFNIPQFYGGVEAWPGIYFKKLETGCLFLDNLRQLPYNSSFWSSLAYPALRDWETKIRRISPPSDLVKPQPFQGFSQYKVEQKPDELEWWIVNLIKLNVNQLLTIGAMHGGVEWHIARVFRENGKDISITTIDISPSLEAERAFEDAKLKFGQAMRLITGDSSSQDVRNQLAEYYDAVFIDGDHSYRGVRSDWHLAKSLHPKLVGFHDIVDSDWHIQCQCCVSRLWNEIKIEYPTEELASGTWGGIGIVKF